jgi:hypothetical protein
MSTYVLQTRPDDIEFDLVYLQGKNFHLSYITPIMQDALVFDSKKTARRFMAHYKMDSDLWEIVKYKAG